MQGAARCGSAQHGCANLDGWDCPRAVHGIIWTPQRTRPPPPPSAPTVRPKLLWRQRRSLTSFPPAAMLAFVASIAPGLRFAPRVAACSARRATVCSAANGPGPGEVPAAVAASKIIVFSKSTCPYCKRAKTLLRDLGESPVVWELNEMPQGPLIQSELLAMTGQRTVPNIFIGGDHVGGSDDLMDLYNSGRLSELIGGASVNQ
jgi:glutaredoxin 3